jgi:prepilin-type N-terminal cleavage/methylation domain-containing protein
MPVLKSINVMKYKGIKDSSTSLALYFSTSHTYHKGFTLVELMVAIAILALLSSIGLVFYGQAELSARDSKRQGDMREIQNALEQYYTLNRAYPNVGSPGNLYATSGNWPVNFFQAGAVPQNPRPVANYTNYYACASPARYVVCTNLEACDNKCNRTNFSGFDPCANGPSDGTSPTGSTGFYCVGSLSN